MWDLILFLLADLRSLELHNIEFDLTSSKQLSPPFLLTHLAVQFSYAWEILPQEVALALLTQHLRSASYDLSILFDAEHFIFLNLITAHAPNLIKLAVIIGMGPLDPEVTAALTSFFKKCHGIKHLKAEFEALALYLKHFVCTLNNFEVLLKFPHHVESHLDKVMDVVEKQTLECLRELKFLHIQITYLSGQSLKGINARIRKLDQICARSGIKLKYTMSCD